MCTVTYLPTGNDQYLFTSNRDESPNRAAGGIQRIQQGSKTLLFPQDHMAKGTWIAVSDANQMVCILNGAFERHTRRSSYRMSRGLMALQFFAYDNAEHFFSDFEFEGLEPFTFIIYDNGKLYDLHWDEQDPNVRPLSTNQTHIWSSCTLYTPELQAQREAWFAEWKKAQNRFTAEDIYQFHRYGGNGNPENDLVMNRYGIVQTTSITHIHKQPADIEMSYHNLLNSSGEKQRLPIIDS